MPLAAALNSIKGEVNTLSQRRGWDSPLDAALFDSNIDRQTLDAMMDGGPRSRSPTSAAICAPKPARSAWTRWPGTTSSPLWARACSVWDV